jgi:hypothetical protein
MDKSTTYLECEPLFAQARVELLDHPTLLRELRLLERRPRAGGKTVVDHPPGSQGHDDYANALALAVMLASQRRPALLGWPIGVGKRTSWYKLGASAR